MDVRFFFIKLQNKTFRYCKLKHQPRVKLYMQHRDQVSELLWSCCLKNLPGTFILFAITWNWNHLINHINLIIQSLNILSIFAHIFLSCKPFECPLSRKVFRYLLIPIINKISHLYSLSIFLFFNMSGYRWNLDGSSIYWSFLKREQSLKVRPYDVTWYRTAVLFYGKSVKRLNNKCIQTCLD